MKKIHLGHQLAYGSGNLLGSGALAVSGAWLLYFYTTFTDLTMVQAASIFSIGSIVDAISNPIMGHISDNFHHTKLGKRFGRRRFFIMIAIPLMVVYPLMWVDGFGYWYYLGTYILFELIYTMVMVPYETLATEMTSDFSLRSKLTGYKAIFGKIANFMAAFIPGRFMAMYGEESSKSFLYTGILFGIILSIAMAALYFTSWERPFNEIVGEKIKSPIENLKQLVLNMLSTFKVKTFRNHLGMYLFGFGAEWLFAASFTYFVVFALGQKAEMVSNLNSFSSIMQLISTFGFITLCIKMGFAKPFRIALNIVILSVIAYTVLYFTDSNNMVIILFTITAFFGLGTGGVYYIPWNVYTFLADVDEMVTGKRREGVYAGAMTFCGKLMRSVIVFGMGWVLDAFGFVSGEKAQPASAINALITIFSIGVISLAILGVISAYRMKLDRATHKIILDEIQRIKDGGTMNQVTAKTKEVVEQLTGSKYETCYQNVSGAYRSQKN